MRWVVSAIATILSLPVAAQDYTYNLDGFVGPQHAKALVQQINSLDTVDTLTIQINSNGGMMSSAIPITQAILAHRSQVFTKTSTSACSAAAYIWTAGGHRYASKDALIAFHLCLRNGNVITPAYARYTHDADMLSAIDRYIALATQIGVDKLMSPTQWEAYKQGEDVEYTP